MIHIYSGNGKGKTTAAVGLLIRAAGSGKKCGFFSFLKSDNSCEINILKGIKNVTVFQMPASMKFVWEMSKDEKKRLKEYYDKMLNVIGKSDVQLLILDESLSAVCEGLADAEKILTLAENRELVITGRGECREFFEKADYITQMKKLKHPFDKGEKARKGIEY